MQMPQFYRMQYHSIYVKKNIILWIQYIGDLNSILVGIQILEICSIVKWFAVQMLGTIVVWYSDYHLVNEPVFRPPIEYQSPIQMSGTMELGIWIANHVNREQVKVCFSNVSAFQMFTIQILIVFRSHCGCQNQNYQINRCTGEQILRQDGRRGRRVWR